MKPNIRRPRWRHLLVGSLVLALGLTATACSGSAVPATEAEVETAPPAAETVEVTAPATEVALTAAPGPHGPGQGQGQGMGHGPGQGQGQGVGHGPGQGHGPGMGHGPGQGQGMGQGGPPAGFGPDNPWRTFHQQPVPEAYRDLTNPLPADEATLAQGEAIYQTQCVVCHGETGLGDGPSGEALDPPPAPLARTAQHLSDGYLYWRIHDGGAALGSAMPTYGNVLSEDEIWAVTHYLRTLGDQVGATDHHEAMLQAAVEQGVLTQDEADLFQRVHALLEAYRTDHWDELRAQAAGNPDAMLDHMLTALVDAGTITQAEADAFRDIHQRLEQADLMP